MYRNDSEDFLFWNSEAMDSARWADTVQAVVRDVYRRGPDNWFQLLEDLERARMMFFAYYHYALARRDLATQEIPMAEMLATQ